MTPALYWTWGGDITLWALIAIAVVLALYLCALVIDVLHSVDSTPRVPMVTCAAGVHGLIPESTLITIFDDMEIEGEQTRKPVRVCPYCFEARVKAAKEQYK